jgi:hypothetical protein
MSAYGYRRVSTLNQAESGESLAAHLSIAAPLHVLQTTTTGRLPEPLNSSRPLSETKQ